MSSTYHHAIEAIPYKVVFNHKPRCQSLDIANRHFTKTDIEEYVFDNDQDDFLIAENEEGQQLEAGGETSVWQSGSISEASEPGWCLEKDEDLTESGEEKYGWEEEKSEQEGSEEEKSEQEGSEEENYTFQPIIETQDELIPEDPTDIDAINTYFAPINLSDSDENESDNDLSDSPPSTPPSHHLNDNLQFLSPQIQSLKLNPESLWEAAELSSTFWAYIYGNQLHANEQSIF